MAATIYGIETPDGGVALWCGLLAQLHLLHFPLMTRNQRARVVTPQSGGWQ